MVIKSEVPTRSKVFPNKRRSATKFAVCMYRKQESLSRMKHSISYLGEIEESGDH